MADVRPFRALGYSNAAGPLGDLVSPPYDVISPGERSLYLAASPYNAVRLILPEVPYDEVGGLIASWREDGVLGVAETPVLVAWTQSFTLDDGVPRERRTILAAVGLEPYERRIVRPHERTHAGPKEDRLRLTRAVRTNLSPVFGLYPDPGRTAWSALAPEGPPDADLTDRDGTVHRLWRVADPAAHAAVAEAMRDRWILIADGHHRYETALAYRDERRAAAAGDGEGPHDRVLMGLTALEDPGLVVLPTHRVLTRRPEGAEAGFASREVDGIGALRAALAEAPADAPALGLVLPEGMRVLTGSPPPSAATPAERLDAAVLEREILIPRLGAGQAALTAEGVLGYTKDAGEAARMVATGAAAAAFVLRPVPTAAVAAVAEAGETMPQKSTYFFPKLLTGVAFHSLVDG